MPVRYSERAVSGPSSNGTEGVVVRKILLAGLAVIAFLIAGTVPAAASPYIHAHRGGDLENGAASAPENSMAAFQASAARGFVLELDVKLTSDDVPVVIHDGTLDRTTTCTGPVAAKSLAELGDCRIDVIGSEDVSKPLKGDDPAETSIPRLSQVLGLIRKSGVSANIEIKNLPTDPDFDPTYAYADTVARAIRDSRVPSSQLILQSFLPANLTEAKKILPEVETSRLTLGFANSGAINSAAESGFDWVSPQWPVDQEYVSRAHEAGLRVVPYTLDTSEDVRTATRLGVDALITNDPVMSRRAVAAEVGPVPRIQAAPSRRSCRTTFTRRTIRPVKATLRRKASRGGPRVFAMQFKQEIRNVKTYRSFRKKIECLIRRWVVPNRSRVRPNVIAFNEDIGMATLGTGSRGAETRKAFDNPTALPGCAEAGPPCGAIAGLAAVGSAYGEQTAAYRSRFSGVGPLTMPFVGATDTLARGWMQVFSDMARRYHVYILGSSNQAPFTESRDPAEIDRFRDPDLERPESVYVATSGKVYNEAFMWGPKDVNHEGPLPLRNVVAQNRKVPLTPIEQGLALTPGPSTGPDAVANLRPYRLPKTRAKIGFATSLPAFVYGYRFGVSSPDIAPCADVSKTYMACLNRLGTNLVMQDEANPGPWAAQGGQGQWQPLEWMGSTWRSSVDKAVKFRYNVTPHMVGNLGDLAFDGQTAITQRGLRGSRKCTYIGNKRARRADGREFRRYAGPKRQFLALVPWVKRRGSRAKFRKVSERLAADSGSKLENRYIETAAIADLPFPPKKRRANCLGAR